MGEEPISLLLGALGGQGGGVLTDWLVESARLAGFPAQATSIPGVAQRTGATTYYFELFPERNPPADPVFCLFPSSGDVDMVVALEPTEAGRALEQGYITDRTTVVTSTLRLYSTAEKSIAGDGVVEVAPILDSIKRVAKALVLVDPASAPGGHINAVVFGAIIGTGVLPLTVENGQAAIKARGLAADANLASFETGLQASRTSTNGFPEKSVMSYDPAPPGFEKKLASIPVSLQPVLGHALARLVDYHDVGYAQAYLDRIEPILSFDRENGGEGLDYRLTQEVAKRLAAWMSHEDIIRVAQLKTRLGRLERIRKEINAQPGQPVNIVDFFSPGREEILGILPAPLTRLLPGENRKNGKQSGSLHLTWPTSSPLGYIALKFLAALKPLRVRSIVFAREQAAIETWLDSVTSAVPVNYNLACQAAELAVWVRGYGDVRARGLACLNTILTNWDTKLSEEPDTLKTEVNASLIAARNDPDATCKRN